MLKWLLVRFCDGGVAKYITNHTLAGQLLSNEENLRFSLL